MRKEEEGTLAEEVKSEREINETRRRESWMLTLHGFHYI